MGGRRRDIDIIRLSENLKNVANVYVFIGFTFSITGQGRSGKTSRPSQTLT